MEELNANLYMYIKEKSTTHCIMDVWATVKNKSATFFFLDLEKAFVLANPSTILEILIYKGVKGK